MFILRPGAVVRAQPCFGGAAPSKTRCSCLFRGPAPLRARSRVSVARRQDAESRRGSVQLANYYPTGVAPPNRPPSPIPLTRRPANEGQEARKSTNEDPKKVSRAPKSSTREPRPRRHDRLQNIEFYEGRRQREVPVGRGISTSLIGGRVCKRHATVTTRPLPSPRGFGGRI